MQDKYAGDIGDFGKLGLLRALAKTGLTIGVNWYHTYPTPKESSGGNGRFTEYLKDDFKEKEMYRSCDPDLFAKLKKLVDLKKRSIDNLEKSDLLPAVYWNDSLDFSGQNRVQRTNTREKWFSKSLQKLSNLDIVFVDPDNGLIVPSAEGRPKSNKYVLSEELEKYYASKASVIYYQHKARKKDEYYLEQHFHLLQSGNFPDATGLCLKFKKTSLRYYFFIIPPEHKQVIEECVAEMLNSPWEYLFKPLDF